MSYSVNPELKGIPIYAQEDQRTEREKKYDQLLYAVQKIVPGETRHETALRYIREAQAHHEGTAQENK